MLRTRLWRVAGQDMSANVAELKMICCAKTTRARAIGAIARLRADAFVQRRWWPWLLAKLAASVAQQFVDAGLGAGLLVDALDDHGAIEAWAGRAVGAD